MPNKEKALSLLHRTVEYVSEDAFTVLLTNTVRRTQNMTKHLLFSGLVFTQNSPKHVIGLRLYLVGRYQTIKDNKHTFAHKTHTRIQRNLKTLQSDPELQRRVQSAEERRVITTCSLESRDGTCCRRRSGPDAASCGLSSDLTSRNLRRGASSG